MKHARLYILLYSQPEPDMGEDENRGELYPRFTFARSRRRALNWFRQVLGPSVPPEAVYHVAPSAMTPRDVLMLAIFGPSRIRGQSFELRVERARLAFKAEAGLA